MDKEQENKQKPERWNDDYSPFGEDFILFIVWVLNIILTGLYYLLYPIMKWHEKRMKEKYK
jgi:hypothetical protein